MKLASPNIKTERKEIKLKSFISIPSLLLLFALPARATENIAPWYKPGDTLNVLALSGLKIRETPSKQGKVLAILNYADQVIVQNDTAKQVPYKVEEMKGFFIKGYWVKIVSNNKKGYVFDGFLSTWAAPERNLSDIELEKWDHMPDYRYFRKTLKSLSKAIVEKCDCEDLYDYKMANIKGCCWTQEFSRGVSYSYYEHDMGGTTFLYFKHITFREAYQIALSLYLVEDYNIAGYDTKSKIIRIRPIKNEDGCFRDAVDIEKQKNGDIVVRYDW